MQSAHVVLLCVLVASSWARPKQDGNPNFNNLDEPLSDPELRRTLLRVFAESLKAAAEAGVQAAKKADTGTADLRPPFTFSDVIIPEENFNNEQKDELLILSGDSPTARSASAPFQAESLTLDTVTEQQQQPQQPLQVEQAEKQPAESREAEIATTVAQTASAFVDAGLSSPAPSPAPPQPTVTLENLNNLSPSDSADVQRFVDAVSTSTDEKLTNGVELFKAPLIAAFALQQEENTGKTRNLFALPVPQSSEPLLRNERLTLSVAGQVAGTQGVSFQNQPQPQASFVSLQRSVPLQQQSFQGQNFFGESDGVLRNLEKRQQLLQEQLVALQRERSALLQRNQRPTRSETLVPAESNVFFSRSLPIYLQPPFF